MAASLMLNCRENSFRLHRIFTFFQTPKLQRTLYLDQRLGSSDSNNKNASDPKNASLNEKPQAETLALEPVKGKIFVKQPIKVLLEAGKKYSFCTCGYSKHQPFCDSSHKAPNFVGNRPHHIRYRSLPFTVEETKEYWLCQCKQSNKRPFCDGSHKRQDIQSAVQI